MKHTLIPGFPVVVIYRAKPDLSGIAEGNAGTLMPARSSGF